MNVWIKTLAGALRRRLAAAHSGVPRLPPSGILPQLLAECEAMARYALEHGLAVPPELIARLAVLVSVAASEGAAGDSDIEVRAHELAVTHRRLAQLIRPATPQAVFLLDAERRRPHWATLLGPLPLVRALTATSLLFLFLVVATALSSKVSADNVRLGFLDSSGSVLLWNALFLLFCAGLGASFSSLFQVHRYVADASYDPKYDASYGARMILGLIAGLILVEVLPPDLFETGSMRSFGKPTLAMLGGFSATAVYRLLQRLVDAMETLVRGDTSAQAQASLEVQRASNDTERMRWQGELAAQLMALQQSIEAGTPAAAIQQRLADFARAMLQVEAARLPPPSASSD
ncbi:hypothetical protein PG878_09440 [Xanthomonas hawaiiensis]|uniref:hypothetical protein n=2 Tax=Xanthomonas TaxID=338 RepID=UPI001ADA7940|nr:MULTISPECIES: hypothetical protein [unclassified Xanthomonas]MBO9874270.1 hypothetical protein [Xanthomonas sp. D-93]WNH46644.1 hypothetical protein PG878_09440 [Xanthomonas sp. A6251]